MGVQSNIIFVDKYKKKSTWDQISKNEVKEIENHIAPLILGAIDMECAKKFDLLCLSYIASRLMKDSKLNEYANGIFNIINEGLLKKQLHRDEVKNNENILREMISDDFMNKSSCHEFDLRRAKVRNLTRYIPRPIFETLITDFTDYINKDGDADSGEQIVTSRFTSYEDKLYNFVKESKELEPYVNIHSFQKISASDKKVIENELKNIDEIEFDKFFKDKNLIIPYVRKTLGLAQLKINEFVEQYKNIGYEEIKLNYIREVLLFISQNGTLDKQDILEYLPFNDILNSAEINELIDKIFDIIS